jgi:hypothetical protein
VAGSPTTRAPAPPERLYPPTAAVEPRGPIGWKVVKAHAPSRRVHVANNKTRESGGTGRRTGLRIQRRKAWGFKSPLSHHLERFRVYRCQAKIPGTSIRPLVNVSQEVAHLIDGLPGVLHIHPPGSLFSLRSFRRSSVRASCMLAHGNLEKSQSLLDFGVDRFQGLHDRRHYRLVCHHPDSLVTERQQSALQDDMPGQSFPAKGASARTICGHSYGAGRILATSSIIKLASHSAVTGVSFVHEISLDVSKLRVR